MPGSSEICWDPSWVSARNGDGIPVIPMPCALSLSLCCAQPPGNAATSTFPRTFTPVHFTSFHLTPVHFTPLHFTSLRFRFTKQHRAQLVTHKKLEFSAAKKRHFLFVLFPQLAFELQIDRRCRVNVLLQTGRRTGRHRGGCASIPQCSAAVALHATPTQCATHNKHQTEDGVKKK